MDAILRDQFVRVLEDLGEDMSADGREKTPERWCKALGEFLEGNIVSPDELVESALYSSEGTGPIVVSGIPYTSVCEHHVVPFYGRVSIALDPGENGKILGLSKYTRVVDCITRRLQIQERIGQQIVDVLDQKLAPDAILVGVGGTHMCCKGRGIRAESTYFTTYAEAGAAARIRILYELIKGTLA